ncbi:MAG TPA: MoaD/ThiS family protein [Anaerolineae bacterium]|nr:MoaD/ThiS family protein [Anaerolineae bacterium]
MITVQVKLFATLRGRAGPPGLGIGQPFPVELPKDATAAHLIEHLGLPAEEVKLLFVNGLIRTPDDVLADGDELGIFPPVGGG